MARQDAKDDQTAIVVNEIDLLEHMLGCPEFHNLRCSSDWMDSVKEKHKHWMSASKHRWHDPGSFRFIEQEPRWMNNSFKQKLVKKW